MWTAFVEWLIGFLQMAFLYTMLACLIISTLVLVFCLIYLSDKQKELDRQNASIAEVE